MNDSRSDGKRAFVDAIKSAVGVDPVHFLQALPDSAALNWLHTKETHAVDLPSDVEEPFQIGKTGKEATLSVPLDLLEWEFLMLLGWHAKSFPVAANTEHVNLLGNGWIRLMTATAVDAAARLVAKMTAAGLPTPQLQIESFCRLSVDPKHLFLSRVMYSYSLPDGDSEQTLTLTLKAVKTTWGTLQSKSADFDLPRNMVRAIHALENGQDPALAGGIKSDNLSRLVFSAFQGIQPLGLRNSYTRTNPGFIWPLSRHKWWSGNCPVPSNGFIRSFRPHQRIQGTAMEHDHDENSAQSEIAEINREYEENLSRSDEEGWFYPDDDGQDDECSSED